MPPGERDPWCKSFNMIFKFVVEEHNKKCGGKFIKVAEPEGYG